MIKYIFAVIFLLFFSCLSKATVLPLNVNDLTTDDYIVYNYNGVDYDIAWASSVSSEIWFIDSDYNYNILFDASFHSGWSFAGDNGIPTIDELLSTISGEELLTLFSPNGQYVQAFEYWNSVFYGVEDNGVNLRNKQIASSWKWEVPSTVNVDTLTRNEKEDLDFEIADSSDTFFDMFYFRVSSVQEPAQSVPEPSSMFIFVAALFALVGRKKLFN